jgi:hypothetical protein
MPVFSLSFLRHPVQTPGPVTILKLAPGKKRPAHPVSWGDAPADSIQAMLE